MGATMRKAQKKEVLDFINSLHQAHEEIKEALNQKNRILAQNMLIECQEFAVSLGENIERLEGEGHITVSYVEEYCEILFRIHEELSSTDQVNENKLYKGLKKQLIKIENSVKNDIHVRLEIVFFPYKASMWDSLESIYLAAREDPNCDAYCVPIPYFDIKQDRTLGQMHYEGSDYPKDIEVIDWQTYKFEERKPDIIFIHNPYDNWNLVSCVHPRFYSDNLKKYTETLVYVPYYSTTGGMAESQRLCPAYINADYIVIQSPKFRDYFDESIPDEKFLAFGSPKFDRIIQKCENPPAPPKEWKLNDAQLRKEGRIVYFYNTSIAGMLDSTEDFLKKMQYVFSCFEGRKDACLLWRPHPLLESTFDSMRAQYKPAFEALKKYFVEHNVGIYDTTPDIAEAIAYSDAYIGDSGTSVTSLFGIAGKPIFILNNRLHSEPQEDSWRGEISAGFNFFEQDRWTVTQGNKLYVSEPFAYDYKYLCDLSEEYAYGNYYTLVLEVNGKLYACPGTGQDILVIGKNGVERKIVLDKKVGQGGAFCGACKYDKYLLLRPFKYPAIVRYDTTNGELKYFEGYNDIFIKMNEKNQLITGGIALYKEFVFLASPTDNFIYRLDISKGISKVIELPIKSRCGCASIAEHKGEFWLLPRNGKTIVRWNPDTGETKEYDNFPSNYECIDPIYGYVCEEYPFAGPAFYEEEIYLPPYWGNMYVKLNMKTGEMVEWKPSFEDGEGTEYFYTTGKSTFIYCEPDETGEYFKIYSYPKRKLYHINLRTNTCEEINIKFDVDELKRHEPGFCEDSEWLKYCCHENSFNSLKNFLDGNITGNQFDKDKQLKAYREIASNSDGSCGQKLYKKLKGSILHLKV